MTKKEVTALSNSNNVKWVDSLISFEKRITKVEKFICTIWYALIIVMLVLQVVTRFILKSSIPWTDESARYLWATLCFIGCGAAISEDAHIEINIIGSLIAGMEDDEKKLKILGDGMIVTPGRSTDRCAISPGSLATVSIWRSTLR